VQLGGEPDLGIHDPVVGQVLGALGGDPGQRVPGLHHADCVLECLEVQLELAALRGRRHPLGEAGRVVGGQAPVTALPGEFHDGLRPQPAIEVIVQQHLRNAADLLDGQRHVIPLT
jgi:hypothetical protein